MENLIYEVRDAKNCLLVGNYELAYEKMQNIDDELTTIELNVNEMINKKRECTATKQIQTLLKKILKVFSI